MSNSGKFDSEAFYERLLRFGQQSQKLVSLLPKTSYNIFTSSILTSEKKNRK